MSPRPEEISPPADPLARRFDALTDPEGPTFPRDDYIPTTHLLRESDPLPRAPRSIDECPVWGDQEIGVVVRMLIEGYSLTAVRRALGIGPGYNAPIDILVDRIYELGRRQQERIRAAVTKQKEAEA